MSQIAGSATQYDVYFNPGTNERVQCDIGTFTNCVVVNADGTVGLPVAAGFSAEAFGLIPGVLHAYKASAADLAGYAAPVPEPQTWALLVAGVGLVGWHVRRLRRA